MSGPLVIGGDRRLPAPSPATIRSIVDRRTPNAAASRSADRKQNLALCGPAGREDVLPRSAGATRRHRADDTVAKATRAILRAELIVVEDIGLYRSHRTPPKASTGLVDAAYGPFRWPPPVRFQGRPWSDIRGP